MPQCPNCGSPLNPQIDIECPKCKEKEIEIAIAEQWRAIEQNLSIIEQYLKDIKQHREERKQLWQDIEDRLQFIERLKSSIPTIDPPSISDILESAKDRVTNQPTPGKKLEFEYDF